MPDVKSPAAFFLPAETFKVKEIHHQISLSSLLKVVIPHWLYEIWDDAQNENVSSPSQRAFKHLIERSVVGGG